MNVADTQNTSKSESYCCVTDVDPGGQAESYGILKGDLLYHAPTADEMNIYMNVNVNMNVNRKADNRNKRNKKEKDVDLDQVVKSIRTNLKSIRTQEIVDMSKSSKRPVAFVIERLVDESNYNDADAGVRVGLVKCSISDQDITKALRTGRGYPQMPCCRKCKYPSMTSIRNHHFLCYKHQDFKHSGSKEKLTMLLAGALYGCQACICEIESGKKSVSGSGSNGGSGSGGASSSTGKGLVLHNMKCLIASKTFVGTVSSSANASKRGSGPNAKSKSSVSVRQVKSKKTNTATVRVGEHAASTKSAVAAKPSSNSASGRKGPTAKKSGSAPVSAKKRKTETPKDTGTSGSKKRKKASTSIKNPDTDEPLTRTFNANSRVTPAKPDRAVTINVNQDLDQPPQNKKNSDRGKSQSTSQSEKGSSSEVADQYPAQHASVAVTPAAKVPQPRIPITEEVPNKPVEKETMFLTDDRSVSKWVPCANPWGEMGHQEGDVVLFSPADYQSKYETYGPNPERFAMDPFESKSMTYHKSHKSQENGGFHVLKLSRDRLALRSWGFTFCYHDFGGACLVKSVEPLSPANAALLVGTGNQFAPLRPNDMIICVNNKSGE